LMDATYLVSVARQNRGQRCAKGTSTEHAHRLRGDGLFVHLHRVRRRRRHQTRGRRGSHSVWKSEQRSSGPGFQGHWPEAQPTFGVFGGVQGRRQRGSRHQIEAAARENFQNQLLHQEETKRVPSLIRTESDRLRLASDMIVSVWGLFATFPCHCAHASAVAGGFRNGRLDPCRAW
jgi:hypothetical protein